MKPPKPPKKTRKLRQENKKKNGINIDDVKI